MIFVYYQAMSKFGKSYGIKNCIINVPLAKKSSISYMDLHKQPIALVGREFTAYHNNLNRFLQARCEPNIIMETHEIYLTHRIAQMNEGIGLSVDYVAWSDPLPDTVIRPFEDLDCTWDTFIVYKKNRILSKAAEDFISFSLQWLKENKQKLFQWPEEYAYLNDWYNS